jgi:hypothetical protein
MNRDNVRGVIIKGGEPFLLLFLRPVVLRGSDIIICLRRALLEWTWRIHRGKGRRTEILRGLFDLGANVRWDGDQMMARDVFPYFVQVFGYIGDEILGRRMLALDLLENFNRRLVWIDFLRGVGKRFLFRF